MECVNIQFGSYDSILEIYSIPLQECEYDDSNQEILQDLKTDEVYMMNDEKFIPKGFEPGIAGFTPDNKFKR